jgi:hypothetical protein
MSEDRCKAEHDEWQAALNELTAVKSDYEPFLSLTPLDGRKDVNPVGSGFMEVAQRCRAAEERYSEREDLLRMPSEAQPSAEA